MRQVMLFLIVFFCLSNQLAAQEEPSFTATLSSDTVGLDGFLQVTFTLSGAQGKSFEPPAFEFFKLAGGPSQSSNFSMVNGKVTQSQSYTYYLKPENTGTFVIAAAGIRVGNELLQTPELSVVVVEQYDSPAPFKQKKSIWDRPEPPVAPEPAPKPRKTYKL